MVEARSFEEHKSLKVAQPVNAATKQDIKNLAFKAALGSFFIIGLGQVYLGHKRRGIALFFMPFIIFISSIVIVVITGLSGIEVFFLLGIPMVWILSIFDAWQLANCRPARFDFLERNREIT